MKNKTAKIVVLCSAALLGMITAVNIVMPDQEYSEGENRVLTQRPAFSFAALIDSQNSYTTEFEEYFNDQFYMRDKWVGLKAGIEKCIGKTENDGVYFAENDNLIETPNEDSAGEVNIKSINSFCASAEVPVYFAIIPNSICVNSEKLPRFADDGGEEAWIEALYDKSTKSKNCALTQALKEHQDEYIYYRTDHHPTSLGAYYIYCSLAAKLGFAPNQLCDYTRETVSKSFYGTMRAKSGAWWIQADEITRFMLPDESYTLTTYKNANEAETNDGLYVWEQLNTRDQYTFFLGGNQPRQVIENADDTQGKRLLVIKDSFSHCIVPFLAAHYAQIHLIDLRYYRSGLQDYINEQGIDEVLILYSAENFKTDKNLVFINK